MNIHITGHVQHVWRWVGALALLLCLALTACGGPVPTVNATPTPALNAALAQMSVYISSYTPGIAFALNARTGAVHWTAQTGVMYGSQAVANGVVYTISRNATNINALRASDGKQLWEYQRAGMGD